MTKMPRFILVLALIVWQLLAFQPAQPAHAATASYYFSPSTVDVTIGQTRTVSLYVSSSSQSINSGSGTIVIPTSVASATSVSKSGSIFTLWTTEPSISGSTIKFGGGLSNPGYKGGSGRVLTFTIRGATEGTGLITLNSGNILANDGNGTDIYSSTSPATVEVTRIVSGAAIASETHPNQEKWYSASDVKLSWSKPSGTSSFSYSFTSPGKTSLSKSSTSETSALFEGIDDGVWTFTVTTSYSDGKSAKSSFVVRIDTIAPSQPEVTVKTKNDKDQFPTFNISSTDKGSGVDHYLIIIDGKEPIKTTNQSYRLPKQLPGNHSYTVTAVDEAGNKSTEATGTFFIEGVPGPVITDSPAFVAMLQPIKLSGKALYGSIIQLYVNDEQVDEFYVSEYLSERQERKSSGYGAEEEVEWSYELKNSFPAGISSIYATQTTSEGNDSFKSNMVEIRILAGWISLGGIIIPIPLLFWISLILVGLLVGLVVFLWKKYVLSWKNKLSSLQQEVDQEITELANDAPAEAAEINQAKEEIDKDFKEAK